MTSKREKVTRPLTKLIAAVAVAAAVAGFALPVGMTWADDVAQGTTSASSGTAANVSASANTGGTQNAENATNASNEGGGSAEGDDGNKNESVVTLDPSDNAIKENQLPDSSFIYDTDLADLSTADSYYDKQTVQVVGEAVGDIVNADLDGQYCWVVLWDDDSTVSVYMKRKDAEVIDTLGDYSNKGTTLQVRGEFHLMCDEHDGASDIHATNVTATAVGSPIQHDPRLQDFLPGIFMLIAGFALLLLFYRLREKER